MDTLQVFLLGKFRVWRKQQPLAGLGSRKPQELLCYLLLNRKRPHTRERLADLLWDNCSPSQSRCYLRKTLWQLQTALSGQGAPSGSDVLLIEPGWVQINPVADLWLDVAVLEQGFELVQHLSGKQLNSHQVEIITEAVDLYNGGLLEGWYQDWCLYERERFQRIYLAMLDKLMEYCEAHHEYGAGLVYGARILRHDPARERTHQQMMRLYYLDGDRSGALHQYERCRAALDEELGVTPDKHTLALYEQIREDQLVPTWEAAEADMTSVAQLSPLPDVLGHLKRLQAVLNDLQCQVQQDIQVVELALPR